jgi:hypothetical protein
MHNQTPHNGPKAQSLAWYCLHYTNTRNEVSPALMECFTLTGKRSYAVKLQYGELEKFGLKPCRALKVNGILGRAIWVENGDILKVADLARAHDVDFAVTWLGYIDLRPEKGLPIAKEGNV